MPLTRAVKKRIRIFRVRLENGSGPYCRSGRGLATWKPVSSHPPDKAFRVALPAVSALIGGALLQPPVIGFKGWVVADR